MSFYIGFVTKDLVVLAVDNKFTYADGSSLLDNKLFQINHKLWGAHLGAKTFGEIIIYFLGRLKFSPFLVRRFPKLIGCKMKYAYRKYANKLLKENIILEGFTNIAIAGFDRKTPFICTWDSSKEFRPFICRSGSIYNCLEDSKGDIGRYIKIVTSVVGAFQNRGITEQKEFLRGQIKKIMKHLSSEYDYISASGDMVFITREGSTAESFNEEERTKREDGYHPLRNTNSPG